MRKSPKISGLYAVTPETADTDRLGSQVAAVLSGGGRVVQYRNKQGGPQLRQEQAALLIELCRARDAVLIVNDDVELARKLGAHGVHLGRDDGSVAHARTRLGETALIGVSCYDSLPRALEARDDGADYVAFGSFFPSLVKPNAVRASLDLLRSARAALALPIVAIGGITIANAGSLIGAGADAVAVITALFEAPDPRAAARAFTDLFCGEQCAALPQ